VFLAEKGAAAFSTLLEARNSRRKNDPNARHRNCEGRERKEGRKDSYRIEKDSIGWEL